MKSNFKKILGMLILAILIVSCATESAELINEVDTSAKDQESIEMKKYLKMGYGFSESNILETADAFIVEGDVCFSKENFWENYLQKTDSVEHLKKHYRNSNLVTKITTIEVSVYPEVPSAWNKAFVSAVSKWNGLNGKIKFKIVSGYCPAYGINVSYKALGKNNTIARSSFPTTKGYPGLTIDINSQCKSSLNTSQKLFTAIHEMGHSIGFMHTDISSGYSQIITKLTSCDKNTDGSSVMNSYADSFSDFSSCDKEAFRKLYPK